MKYLGVIALMLLTLTALTACGGSAPTGPVTQAENTSADHNCAGVGIGGQAKADGRALGSSTAANAPVNGTVGANCGATP